MCKACSKPSAGESSLGVKHGRNTPRPCPCIAQSEWQWSCGTLSTCIPSSCLRMASFHISCWSALQNSPLPTSVAEHNLARRPWLLLVQPHAGTAQDLRSSRTGAASTGPPAGAAIDLPAYLEQVLEQHSPSLSSAPSDVTCIQPTSYTRALATSAAPCPGHRSPAQLTSRPHTSAHRGAARNPHHALLPPLARAASLT
jgi:hypothetical protein